MSEPIKGYVSASIQAGTIEATATKPNHIGQQVAMTGSGVMIYIRPEVARQWIGVLTEIATNETSD
jgi:hypothetical protein